MERRGSRRPEVGGGAAAWARPARHEAARAAVRDQRAKRALDLVVSTMLLLVLFPLLLLIAALVAADSPGPVLFRQERVGARPPTARDPVWRPRTFSIFKFRSMRAGADQGVHRAHVEALARGAGTAPAGGSFKLAGDPRVTRVGRLLRRTSLDELPQLLNVLRGEMSLVGPRPVPPYEVATYRPWQRERLQALPGITGLWQVRGRGRVTVDEAIAMDVAYVRTRTLWRDVGILCRTVPAVLSRKGAG